MKGGLLLDVVVSEGSSVLELLSGEDESLLVRWDALLVLDLGFDVLDGVGLFDLKGDGLASQGLDEYLHVINIDATVLFVYFVSFDYKNLRIPKTYNDFLKSKI